VVSILFYFYFKQVEYQIKEFERQICQNLL